MDRLFVKVYLKGIDKTILNGQSAGSSDKEIKIGATAGPHAEVVEAVAKEAEKQGIHIKVVWCQEVHCRQIQRYDRTG